MSRLWYSLHSACSVLVPAGKSVAGVKAACFQRSEDSLNQIKWLLLFLNFYSLQKCNFLYAYLSTRKGGFTILLGGVLFGKVLSGGRMSLA